MSLEIILTSIEELTQLHDKLIQASSEKTEALKAGNADVLQGLLVTERKLVRQLEKTEGRRQHLVNEWFVTGGYNEEPTLTNMLEHLSGIEKEKVEQASAILIDRITVLKQQEQLNMALLQQSLQFVQLSLDMVQPSISNMNYGQHANSTVNDRSVFDSKA